MDEVQEAMAGPIELILRLLQPQHCSIYPKSIPCNRKILLYKIPFRSGPAKNVPYSRKFHISESLITGIVCSLLSAKQISPVIKNKSLLSAKQIFTGSKINLYWQQNKILLTACFCKHLSGKHLYL